MPFGLFNFKRKFIAIMDPTSIVTNGTVDGWIRPRKRMRVQESASILEANTLSSQACAAGHEGMDTLPPKTEENEEELQAKLKESEETYTRLKKEAEHAHAQVKKLQEQDLCCMICHEVIQNPQTLKCGHSACYPCLRRWWTRPPTENDGGPMIDTEAESDLEEEAPGMNVPNPVDPAPAPRHRRRHRFSSAVNREKHCPYCNELIKCRPVPNFRIREILETSNNHLLPLPPHVQARKNSRRNDLWHGMFHTAAEAYRELVPAHVRAAEEAQQRERDQLLAEGRAAGALEARRERARVNQAQRAIPVLLQFDFWRGNPPR